MVYVEPGVQSCPPIPPATAPKTVRPGDLVKGRIRVACGFEQGSYTLTLNASDPEANIAPKTMLVNFGRLVGDGSYTVRFVTTGLHKLSAAITSNMGSPAVQGYFVSVGNEFKVVQP